MILLLPAAGSATRLPALQGRSKEALTIAPGRRAADALLDAAAHAGAERAVWLLRSGKADIRKAYGDQHASLPLDYCTLPATPSTLHTLRAALTSAAVPLDTPRIGLGFPDIQFRDANAFSHLEHALKQRDADLALGCFHTDRPDKVDVVEQDSAGRVTRVHIKSADAPGSQAWILALWRPRFTRFLCDQPEPEAAVDRTSERYIGHEIQAAIDAGLHITAVHFDSPLLDLGTPEDLARVEHFWLDA